MSSKFDHDVVPEGKVLVYNVSSCKTTDVCSWGKHLEKQHDFTVIAAVSDVVQK